MLLTYTYIYIQYFLHNYTTISRHEKKKQKTYKPIRTPQIPLFRFFTFPKQQQFTLPRF